MRFVARVKSFLRAVLFRRRMERDMEREWRFHIGARIDDLVATGLPRADAATRARFEFGDQQRWKEYGREARGLRFIDELRQDAIYATRQLAGAPLLTLVAVVTLALGVGANTAIFSTVNAVLFRPLPVNDPDQLVTLSFRQSGSPLTPAFSYPDYQDIRAQTAAAFSDILAYRVGLDGLGVNGQSDRIMVHYVTGNYFTLLGVKPFLGRLILPSEGDEAGADPVIVLGYSYWQTRFAGDPNVVGKHVLVDGHPVTIVGVAPKHFRSIQAVIDVQGYLPLGMVVVEGNYPSALLGFRNMRMFSVVGRLRPHATVQQANAVLKVAERHLSDTYPKLHMGMTLEGRPEALDRIPLGGGRRLVAMSTLSLGMAGLVLVLTCVNLANLLVVRSTARGKEMAMRAALGGSRGRLIRQLLTESLILALLGGLGGFVLGVWTSRAFGAPEVQGIPIHLEAVLDWRLFEYGFVVTVLSGLMLGVLPAWRASHADLAIVLRGGGRRLSGQRLRTVLVSGQIAGSFLLLIVASLLWRSLDQAQRLDLGFDAKNVVNFSLDPQYVGYNAARGQEFFRELLRRVGDLPSIESASLGCCGPMSPSLLSAPMRMDSYTPRPDQSDPTIFFNQVSGSFFDTLRIPVVRGRPFLMADDRNSPRVAIINQTMAERYWPGQNPLGHTFQFAGDSRPWMHVVGVVRDGKYLGISDEPQPYFYLPLDQNYGSSEVLLVRSRTAPEAVMAQVRKEIGSLAPGLPVTGVETMIQQIDESGGLGGLRRSAWLAAALGGLGLTLAVIGLYGVVSYSVEQRTSEIGIRVALGAQAGSVLSLILGEAVKVICGSLFAGAVLSWAAAPVVRSFLVGISPTDPFTYVAVASLLSIVTLAACVIPARRAMRVNAIIALRQD